MFEGSDASRTVLAMTTNPAINLFGGAFGHTYGHHSVWQMWDTNRNAVNNPLMPWHDAIQQPGAGQMRFGRKLIESRAAA